MTYLTSVTRSIATGTLWCVTATYLHILSVQKALAFGGPMPEISGTAQGGTDKTRNSVIQVINFVLTFLALVAVIFVIVGGIRILASGGNEESVQKGRKTIVMAIIGLIIIFFARVIVGFFTEELSTAGNFT